MSKLRIRRNRHHWVVEQNGLMVDHSLSFRKACSIAGEWHREGWVLSKGWYRR